MKHTIKLTEADLHKMVKEAINQAVYGGGD